MKGFKDSSNKFHPITDYKKGVRKSRDQTAKTEGVRFKKSNKTRYARTKMMYVYDTYDNILDLVEGISTHHFEDNKEIVLEKIREFREEVPTTKQVCREFGYNHKDKKGFEEFASFVESNSEIDEGVYDEKISPKEYSGYN